MILKKQTINVKTIKKQSINVKTNNKLKNNELKKLIKIKNNKLKTSNN